METQLKIIGILLCLLALLHVVFPKYFNWKVELQSLSLINRQLMTVHTFFVALVVLLMGLLCLTSAHALIHTKLGHTISLGFAIFWILRLLVQFFGYSSKLWKGKAFETTVHIFFSLFWAYLSWTFLTLAFPLSF
ncbi:MAG: hypothetical protein NWS31_05535 [Crocinitomicaceae bacterium]|jgi:hypothetical protein|nr:hypothetical protein [Crocinitomicaceae bacterium]MDP4806522.1 hypothetical protein [Crocinitomicaceae bacterium]